MNMDLFYSSDIAWAPMLAWVGAGIVSFIVGVILLIIASVFKPPIKEMNDDVSVNNSTSMFISSDDE